MCCVRSFAFYHIQQIEPIVLNREASSIKKPAYFSDIAFRAE